MWGTVALVLATMALCELPVVWEKIPRVASGGHLPQDKEGATCAIITPTGATNTYLFVVGGRQKTKGEHMLWDTPIHIMTMGTHTWTGYEGLDDLTGRSHHAMYIRGDMLYIHGGMTATSRATGDFFSINVQTSVVTDLRASPVQRQQHTIDYAENLAVVIGGVDESNDCSSEMVIYHFETDEWDVGSHHGYGGCRTGHSTVVLDDRYILLFGGSDVSQGFHTELVKWDARDGKWAVVPGDVPERSGHTMSYVPRDNLVYLFGGLDSKTIALSDPMVYALDTHEWTRVTTTGPSPAARMRHCSAVSNATGSVYVFGGMHPYQQRYDDLWRMDKADKSDEL